VPEELFVPDEPRVLVDFLPPLELLIREPPLLVVVEVCRLVEPVLMRLEPVLLEPEDDLLRTALEPLDPVCLREVVIRESELPDFDDPVL